MKFKFFLVSLILTIILIIPIYNYNELKPDARILMGNHQYQLNTNYYIAYNLKQKGFIKPTITSAIIIDKNDNKLYDSEFLIDEEHKIGIVDEASYLEEKESHNLVPLKNYKVKNLETQAVLKLNIKDKSFKNSIEGIQINYTILGIPKRLFIDTNIIDK